MASQPAPVVLVYGAGKGVGSAVLKQFRSKGWKTAATVREDREEHKAIADVAVSADFASVDSIGKAYTDVETKLGTPNAVVYNGGLTASNDNLQQSILTHLLVYSFSGLATADNPLALAPDLFVKDTAVNLSGLYAAAFAAANGFAKLPVSAPKVFIFTGNAFPTLKVPEVTALGSAKSAGAHIIETAAHSYGGVGGGYKGVTPTGSKWYFADERTAEGKPVMAAIDAEAHAQEYWTLAERSGEAVQSAWNWTFVKGKGYVKFADVVDHAAVSYLELM